MRKVDYTKDLENKIFGYLKVLHVDNERPKGKRRNWICKCTACGKIVSIPRQKLISGDSKSCGCMMSAPARKNDLDLTGRRFGKLTVLYKISGKGVNAIWKCRCDCGNETNVIQQSLISGRTKSCGCVHREKAKQNIKKYMGIVNGTNASRMKSNKLSAANTSGVKGVSYNKNYEKYYAYIGFKNKLYSLGFYDKIEEARAAREKAEKEIFGPFLEWYSENYPEQWKRMQKKKSNPGE